MKVCQKLCGGRYEKDSGCRKEVENPFHTNEIRLFPKFEVDSFFLIDCCKFI